MSQTPSTRILFLARRYPPSIGGVQNHCYQLYRRLSQQREVKLIALGRETLLHLIWFVPYTFLISFFEVLFRRVDVIYFSDGVICVLAPFLRPFTRARFVVTIYGLEMTYSSYFFGSLMKWGVKYCEKIAVISEITRDVTHQSGVSLDKIAIIYLGIEPPVLPEDQREIRKEQFEKEHQIRFGHDKMLLHYGRMVSRKGMAAFLEKGMPLLDQDIKLFISGLGPDKDKVQRLSESPDLKNRVKYIFLEDENLAMLRAEVDLFLMPNVPYLGDLEGFGIAPLECMYDGTPVVAFAVDALVESVQKGGYLIPPNDYKAYTDQIHQYFKLSKKEKQALQTEAKEYVRQEYTWEKTAREYLDLFEGKP